MASPFRIFRKHQKVMIVTLCGLAMVAFVFLDSSVLDGLSGGSTRNPVVAKTTKYGKLRAREVEHLRAKHQTLTSFLTRLQQQVLEAGGRGEAVMMFERQVGPSTEENIVNTWLHVEHAKRLGLVVSNEAVNQVLRELSEDRVNSAQLSNLIKGLGIGQVQLFELIRHEMLALQLGRMFELSLQATTPGQRWDYYTRLRRETVAQTIAVPVADFVDEIADPGDEQLKAFFEEHKDQYAQPSSPEPGFRVPHRVAVKYFQADGEMFRSPEVITDEEVRAEYEKNKDEWDRRLTEMRERRQKASQANQNLEKAVDQATSEAGSTTPESQSPESQSPESQSNATEQPTKEPAAVPATKDDAAETSETPETSEMTESVTEPAAEEPAETTDDAKDDGKDTAKQPAEEDGKQDGNESSKDDDPKDDEQKTSAVESASPFRLTALLQEEEAATAEDKPAEDKPADTEMSQPEASPAAPANEAATQPEPATPVPTASPVADASPAAASQPATEPEPEDPLKGELGDAIRNRLAYEKIEQAFSDLQDVVLEYRTALANQLAAKVKGRKPKQVNEPDYEALAKQYHMTLGQTPLISPLQLADYPIGQSYVVEARQMFGQYAFQTNWPVNLTAKSMDLSGHQYLFWKTEDAPERIPKFDEEGVRDEVLHAWKMIEARSWHAKRPSNWRPKHAKPTSHSTRSSPTTRT